MNLESLVHAYAGIDPGEPETVATALAGLPEAVFPWKSRESLLRHCSARNLPPGDFVRGVLKTRILAELGAAPAGGDKEINRHQCFSCALKHLASALVIASEIKTGYDNREYALYLLGNLAEAQEQTARRAPTLANRIRKVRLRIFGDGGTPELTPEAFDSLLALADDVRRVADGETAPRKIRKDCGCSKKH